MTLSKKSVAVLCAVMVLNCATAAPPDGKASLNAVIARMDKAAADFKVMSAQVTYVTYTAVLNESSTETGTVVMKKVQPGEVQGLVQFLSPDPYELKFEKRTVQIYRPKIKQLEVYDLAKYSDQVDRFMMLGFGMPGTELARDYDMTVVRNGPGQGESGNPTIQLRLIPKSSDAKQYVKSIDVWIPEEGNPYPEREKILLNSDDYKLITYSDLKINPALAPDALQLKVPAGVKTVYPGK